MSSVPAVASRLPLRLPASTARTRRIAVIVTGLVLLALAAAGLVATGRVPLGDGRQRASTPSPELAVARAKAVAVAKSRARAPAPARAQAPALQRPDRVADASRAADLFATHSWFVPPPPPPAVAPLPPPPLVPSAPPFPYTYVGSYTPAGDAPVFFMARGDRVVDMRVGDHVDGVYDFETAEHGQLVFNYLPLNIRQTVPTGAPE